MKGRRKNGSEGGEPPKPVFFSLKDHFDEHMGDPKQQEYLKAPEMQKYDSSKGSSQSEEKPADDDDGFFDATDTWATNVESGTKSLRYNAAAEDRTELPVSKPMTKISIWKILKDSVGKDLSKLAVPVYFNEPISMLQKVSEVLEYENLLMKAVKEQDPARRLVYVTAFGIANYHCTVGRVNKPFNPILGETFEFVREGKFKYISEQVSHHPPISAGFASNEHYDMWMNTSMKSQFWGKSMEVKPLGLIHTVLKGFNGEHYTIERPSSYAQNIIFGNMYIEHVGTLTVRNHMTGHYCEV